MTCIVERFEWLIRLEKRYISPLTIFFIVFICSLLHAAFWKYEFKIYNVAQCVCVCLCVSMWERHERCPTFSVINVVYKLLMLFFNELFINNFSMFTAVVWENAAILISCKTPGVFCGLKNFTWTFIVMSMSR